MQELKRIDPSQVPALFQGLKIKPSQACFFRPLDTCHDNDKWTVLGCVSAGLAAPELTTTDILSRMPGLCTFDQRAAIEPIVREMGFSASYFAGLLHGWDSTTGQRPKPEHPLDAAEHKAGFEDGYAAWLACCEAGLVD